MDIRTKAMIWILANYHYNPSMKSLADHLGLSYQYLFRRFRFWYVSTPKQFVLEMRLQEAKRLLQETKVPIQEISDALSFPNHSDFCFQFRRKFGKTPSEMRKQSWGE